MAEREVTIDLNNKPLQEQPKENKDIKQYDMGPKSLVIKDDASVVDILLSSNQDELLPWETIQLPSLGIYYGGRIPDGKVEVRPLGLTADKILATSRLTQSGQAIDHIFKRYVRFPDKEFDPLELLVGDRTFLLFYLRGITHDHMYEFSIECSNESCSARSFHEYDLNQLQSKIQAPKAPSEPIRVALPYLTKRIGKDVWCEFRLMRGHDLQSLERIKKSQARLAGNRNTKNDIVIDKDIEEQLCLLVLNINGVSDHHKVQKIVKEKMSSSDTQAINEAINSYSPGIDLKIEIVCPECNNHMSLMLPITETFFRPQNRRGIGEGVDTPNGGGVYS